MAIVKTISAAGSGQKSYISTSAASSFSTWTNVSTGATGSSTSTGSELPEATVGTALKVTNGGSGTGYVESTEMLIDGTDLGKLLAIMYNFRTSTSTAYVAGDFQIQVWDSTTSGGSYAQNTTISTLAVPVDTDGGSYQVTFSQNNARPYTKIRIVRSAGASGSWASFSSIVLTSGSIQQGAAISGWVSFTPATTNTWTTNTTWTGRYRRVGSTMEVRYGIVLTGAPGGTAQLGVNLPTGYALDTTAILTLGRAESLGYAHVYQIANSGIGYMLPAFAEYDSGVSTSAKVRFMIVDDASGSNHSTSAITATNPNTFGNLDYVEINLTVPIAEWSGSGTVNLGPGAQVEYASNSTAWGTANSSAFQYGPAGAVINGDPGAGFTQRVRFQYPIQSDDLLILEGSSDRQVWHPLVNGRLNYGGTRVINSIDSVDGSASGATFYGVSGSTTDIDVSFGRYATIANDDAPTTNWPTTNAYWRVRKAKASSPVGSGKADSSSSGLVNPRKGQYSLTVTSTVAGWSTARAVGIYYQDQDGNHRLRLNVAGTVTSGTYTGGTWTITGVTFKNISNYLQPMSVYTNGSGISSPIYAYASPNTATVIISNASSGASTTQYAFSGDVELDSKPSWA